MAFLPGCRVFAQWLEKLQKYVQFLHCTSPWQGAPESRCTVKAAMSAVWQTSHNSGTLIGMLTFSNMTCGYSPQQLHSMKLANESIGHLLNAKENDEQPSCNFARSQPTYLTLSFATAVESASYFEWDTV